MEHSDKDRRYCPNCYYPMGQDAGFCGQCGQKYTTGKVKLGTLLWEFFESVLNVDSKIFRTIGALFNPGKLTNEYFSGRHKAFIAPLRLFFFMAVVHFAVIGLTQSDIIQMNLQDASLNDTKRRAYHDLFMIELDSARQVTLEQFNENATSKRVLDTLYAHMENTRQDSMSIGYLSHVGNFQFENKEIRIARKDLVNMSVQEVLNTYGVEDLIGRLIAGQIIKLNLEGEGALTQNVIGNMVWMVILMMPALALILKLLYIRRKRYFVEHLVFSFHYHAFSFFIVSIALITMTLLGDDQFWIIILAYASLLPYLFIAMRRVYKQGFFKTFFKFTFLNFSYLFIFVLFFILTAIISALTF